MTSLRREPFRLFFPAAILASVVGVALWPLVYAGGLDFYPAQAHARLMIQGFVGGFAMGFLGTAFPKMIESPSLTWPELCILLMGFGGCIVCHAINHTAAGDWFFLAIWFILIACLAVRFAIFRHDLPPPEFVLVGMGLLAGVVGVMSLLVGRIIILTDFQRNLAPLLHYEAFILGPILGVGGFLFPRFFAADPKPEGEWKRAALTALVVGLALLGTYIAQAQGMTTAAPVARAVIVASYLLTRVSIFRRGAGTGSLSAMLRWAILCVVLGILLSGVVAIPVQVGMKHLLFIGGYGLLILAVASRVTWGHSGNIALADGKRISLRLISVLVLIAMATRVVADFVPAIRISHHIYAALLWVIAVGIWSWAVLRFVRYEEADEGSSDPT